MNVDVFLYQERTRLRTEKNQLENLILQQKVIVPEQVEILKNEIAEKKRLIDCIDYLIKQYRERQYCDLLDGLKL